MIQLDWVRGFDIGLEYGDTDDYGFVVTASFGIFRVMWFKDLVRIDDDDE